MQILILLSMYFHAVVVEVKKNLLLIRLALAILVFTTKNENGRSIFILVLNSMILL